MKLEDIRPTGKKLVLAKTVEVDALASTLWITFPDGYRDYVTKFGEGLLGGSFVRIYPPWRIEKELADWRRRIGKHWFWDQSRKLLPKERGQECVIIGDTVNGDELIFHPSRPNVLFVLPSDSEGVFVAGGDLLEAVEWMCNSGALTEPFAERDFEPFDSRLKTVDDGTKKAVGDPPNESLDDLIELVKSWGKRHSAKETARKDLRKRTTKGSKAELVYEGLIVDGPSKLDIGYAIAWRILDKETKTELGRFTWSMRENSRGSSYHPTQPH
jgi:hypothetical protein